MFSYKLSLALIKYIKRLRAVLRNDGTFELIDSLNRYPSV